MLYPVNFIDFGTYIHFLNIMPSYHVSNRTNEAQMKFCNARTLLTGDLFGAVTGDKGAALKHSVLHKSILTCEGVFHK